MLSPGPFLFLLGPSVPLLPFLLCPGIPGSPCPSRVSRASRAHPAPRPLCAPRASRASRGARGDRVPRGSQGCAKGEPRGARMRPGWQGGPGEVRGGPGRPRELLGMASGCPGGCQGPRDSTRRARGHPGARRGPRVPRGLFIVRALPVSLETSKLSLGTLASPGRVSTFKGAQAKR